MAVVRRDSGMVTAETATVAPLVVLAAVTAIWVVSLGVTQARATDAAREAARMVARGDPAAEAEKAALETAARGSHVEIEVEADTVRVQVDTSARLPLFGGIGTTVSGQATASTE